MPDTASIRLTPLRAEDSAALFAWINDRDTVVFNGPYRPVHTGAHAAWFEAVQQRSDQSIFAIRARDDDRLIGTCQLLGINPVHRSAELQIRIGAAGERGQGFGTAAARALVAYGFRDLNLHRIHLHVLADNVRAIASYRKIGFLEEGRLREAAWIDGRWVDLIAMALLRDAWDGAG